MRLVNSLCFSCCLLILLSVMGLLNGGSAAMAQSGPSRGEQQVGSQMELILKKLDALTELVNKQQSEIDTLKKENQQLKRVTLDVIPESAKVPAAAQPDQSAPPAAQSGFGGFAVPSGVFGQNGPLSTVGLNPEIGATMDVVGSWTQSDTDEDGNDRFSVRSLEFAVGQEIDPFSRFDSTISFSDQESPEIEEAYISYWNLPGDTLGRLGRVRQQLGLINPAHPDQIEMVNEPLFIQEYFGKEGLFRTGLEFSNYIPAPWDNVTHRVVVGMMEGGVGEGGTLFGSSTRIPSYYASLQNSWDASASSNFDFGGYYLVGSADDQSNYNVSAFGADLRYQYRFDSERKIRFQNEALFQSRSAPYYGDSADEADLNYQGADTPYRKSPWGMYSLVDLSLSREWSIGTLFDYVQPINIDTGAERSYERGLSGIITFHQSEFLRVRLQYQYVDLVDGGNDNRFFLQTTASIGSHKHALY